MAHDTEALLALADRVEALNGPDREVDALICATLRIGIEYDWAIRNYPNWTGAKNGRVNLEKNGPSFDAPLLTVSLDAALTLVPEGYGFQIDGFGDHWRSSLSEEEGFNAKAATPALALTAAALRAIARKEPTP